MDEVVKICSGRSTKLKVGHWYLSRVHILEWGIADDVLLIARNKIQLKDNLNAQN